VNGALAVAGLLIGVMQAPAAARPLRISYTIALPQVTSHLYSITIAVDGLAGRPVNLQMPVWSPGRYGRMDFAKNVQEFAASGTDGKPLRWDKINGSLWRVFPEGGRATGCA